MKYILSLLIIMGLASCGFEVTLREIQVSSTSNVLQDSALQNSLAGTVSTHGAECNQESYSLKDSQDGYFKITNEGLILLAKNNPPAKIYNLIVFLDCDKQIKEINISIEITQSAPIITTFVSQFQTDVQCIRNTIDHLGNIYCAGGTNGSPGETNAGSFDAYVAKINPLGVTEWITQLGTTTKAFAGADHSQYDFCTSVTVDSMGNVYCSGVTRGSIGEANGGDSDLFIMKLNSSGVIQWATQLGNITKSYIGADHTLTDACSRIKVDNSGNVYCAGYTSGSLGETNGGIDDAFILKLDSSGSLQWVTQLGATTKSYAGADHSQRDRCADVDVDNSGNVYCSGYTDGSLGEANGGSEDIFVMKLNSSGTLQWVTQLGSTTTAHVGANNSHYERCHSISIDNSGNVYCAGETGGGIGEANAGSADAFVMKLDTSGTLQWVTQLGATTMAFVGADNSQYDVCRDVAVDSSNNVYCAGETGGSIGEANAGSADAFVMKLDTSGTLQWVTQLGATTMAFPGADNSKSDNCTGIVVDNSGYSYCTGYTSGSLGRTNPGGHDGFVMKLDSSGNL